MSRVARWCFRHRFIVLGGWIALFAVLLAVSASVDTAYSSGFTLKGTDSSRAIALLKSSKLAAHTGDVDSIVIHARQGTVTDAGTQEQVSAMLAKVARLSSVDSVVSPYSPKGAGQVSSDKTIAYASVTFKKQGQDLTAKDVQSVIDAGSSIRSSDLQVEFGGQGISNASADPTSASELIGILAAAVILVIAFGSVLSMLIPIISAIFALGSALEVVGLLSHVISIASIGPTIGALVGLGVGIDYALFIVTRYRNSLRSGMTAEDAAVTALNTSGRAVLFAGGTVVIAMLGLLILNVSFLTGVGISAAIVVAFAVLAASTLLPAFFGLFRSALLSGRERKRLAATGPVDASLTGFWSRWARGIRRRPALLGSVAAIIMLALVVPAFSIRLGSSDQGNGPSTSTTRKAYDLLASGFGPGYNGPLQLVAKATTASDQTAVDNLVSRLRTTPGVAAVVASPAVPGNDVRVIQVTPTTSPQSVETTNLIKSLRTTQIPAAEKGTGLKVYVGGQTAIFEDFGNVLTAKLPLFVLVVVLLGCLLLVLAFRSIVIPLTAAAMNLLSAGAAFGVVVAVFQWGWGSETLGLGKAGPVEAFLPVMMLAILFGLSMDYEVFLVSRMREEWLASRNNRFAVRVGQAETGRVIAAAAAIMICVFLAFVFGGQRIIGEFGLGLAAAIFLDALLVRSILVPALMHLFGTANWWLPRWLDRVLPHLSVEAAEVIELSQGELQQLVVEGKR